MAQKDKKSQFSSTVVFYDPNSLCTQEVRRMPMAIPQEVLNGRRHTVARNTRMRLKPAKNDGATDADVGQTKLIAIYGD